MKDTWTWLNEVVQNIIGLALIGTFIYCVVSGVTIPVILEAFTAAVLLYFGYRAVKTNGNNKQGG